MLAKKLGYQKFLITKSPDSRGIDVALFYKEGKIQYLNHKEIVLDPKKFFPTRNILAVNFSVRGNANKVIGVFVNHWPAQGAPSRTRVKAAEYLYKAIKSQQSRYGKSNYHVIATGDFNVTNVETPHAFQHYLTNPTRSNSFFDVQDILATAKASEKSPIQAMMPQSSYFFGPQMAWNRFDRFMISGNLIDGRQIEFVKSSFRVVAPGFMTKSWTVTDKRLHHFGSTIFGLTKRFNFQATSPAKTGFSDHFPIVMKIRY